MTQFYEANYVPEKLAEALADRRARLAKPRLKLTGQRYWSVGTKPGLIHFFGAIYWLCIDDGYAYELEKVN